jgi:hypothetical protein
MYQLSVVCEREREGMMEVDRQDVGEEEKRREEGEQVSRAAAAKPRSEVAQAVKIGGIIYEIIHDMIIGRYHMSA